jgi:SAM-dependent MidA family methyltransferase
MRHWRTAMADALYGSSGFFRRSESGPADHFRTSAHTGAVFARAMTALIANVDAALGHPDHLDVVDIGGGRGELLAAVVAAAHSTLRNRLRPIAIEIAPRPADLPEPISWRDSLPDRIDGVLIATEWLDNVPLDVAMRDGDEWRYVLVDVDGAEALGEPVDTDDSAWLRAWWPSGVRAEIGWPRDAAWADAVARLRRGLALAVDYGHTRQTRPPGGTLTGFMGGRETVPVPDGSRDLTAHVAVDAAAAAGSAVAGLEALLVPQSAALAALGVDGRRPPIEMAQTDPGGYVRALADASIAAELTDPEGLGGHFWLLQPVDIEQPLATAYA